MLIGHIRSSLRASSLHLYEKETVLDSGVFGVRTMIRSEVRVRVSFTVKVKGFSKCLSRYITLGVMKSNMVTCFHPAR